MLQSYKKGHHQDGVDSGPDVHTSKLVLANNFDWIAVANGDVLTYDRSWPSAPSLSIRQARVFDSLAVLLQDVKDR
jgi:hypothetical protein